MNKRIITAALAALISLPLVINAADEKKKGPSFKDMAGAKDHITLADYKKAMAGGKMDDAALEKRFKGMDANGDNKVTQAEYQAAAQKKKKS